MAQTKNVNITPGRADPVVIYASQGDVGREITINVSDGSGWYDLTGCTAVLAGVKPSGMGFSVNGTVSGHTVTIETDGIMTNEYGSIACELKITNGDDETIGTANMILSVEKDPHPEHTVDGNIDEIIPELVVLIERIEADIEEAEEEIAQAEVLKDAEAWAVGKRGGVDVPATDPTYHNNAKYYKDQAASSATEAAGHADDAADSATEASGFKSAAAASADNASYQRSEALQAKTDAEAAAALAASYVTQARNVFQITGDASFSIDPDTRKVTFHITESEESE